MPRNENIGCTVNECRNHSNEGQFCSLNKIQVKKHGNTANTIEHTDCGSFQVK